MATLAYYQWVAAGRPLEPCTPVREIVERMKVAYPEALGTFSWYANEAHYMATPPEDHTPFSATGWPLPSPRWIVFATDIMHRPDLGVDCNVLFAYWIAEARAGRMPWLKYLIWQAKVYSVRNGWNPAPSSGHFDHIHLSTRTDNQFTHLGAWSLTPSEDDMTPEEHNMLAAAETYAKGARMAVEAIAAGLDTIPTGYPDKDGVLDLKPFWARVRAEAAAAVQSGAAVDHTHTVTVTGAGGTGPAQPLEP